MCSMNLFPKLETLKYWIKEREKIRQARVEGKPKPWTTDPILQSYRFCNVFREDDAVTQWIANNVRKYYNRPEFSHFSIIVRQLNLPSSIHAILKQGWPYDDYRFYVEDVRKTLHDIKNRGGKVFNAAYIVSTNGVAMDKIDYLAHKWTEYYKEVIEWSWYDIQTLEQAHSYLTQLDGISDFMAGQVIADLKHTAWLGKATDWWDWCAPGPGSKRGLNRIMGKPIDSKFNKGEFVRVLLELRNALDLPNKLCLQDLQNCLCETDKYMRAQDGGRPKQSYPGR